MYFIQNRLLSTSRRVVQFHRALADLLSHRDSTFFFFTVCECVCFGFYFKVTSKSSQQCTRDPKPWPLQKIPFKYKKYYELDNKCYLKCNWLNTSFCEFSLSPLLWSLWDNTQTLTCLTCLPPAPARFLSRTSNTVTFPHWLIKCTFTSQDKRVTLPNVSTHLPFYQTQTNKQKNIYFLDSFNVQKGSSKTIISKRIKLMYSKSQKILSFFFFTEQMNLQKHWDIFVEGFSLFPDLKSYFYGSLSPFHKAFNQTRSWKAKEKMWRSIEVTSV